MNSLPLQNFLDEYNSQEIQDDYLDKVSDYSEDINEEVNLINNRRGIQWED